MAGANFWPLFFLLFLPLPVPVSLPLPLPESNEPQRTRRARRKAWGSGEVGEWGSGGSGGNRKSKTENMKCATRNGLRAGKLLQIARGPQVPRLDATPGRTNCCKLPADLRSLASMQHTGGQTVASCPRTSGPSPGCNTWADKLLQVARGPQVPRLDATHGRANCCKLPADLRPKLTTLFADTDDQGRSLIDVVTNAASGGLSPGPGLGRRRGRSSREFEARRRRRRQVQSGCNSEPCRCP